MKAAYRGISTATSTSSVRRLNDRGSFDDIKMSRDPEKKITPQKNIRTG
jgi:hypothetical protein